MKNIAKRIVTIMLAVFAAGQCFAPIEGKPDGKNFHGELSQQELSRLQGSGVINSSGGESEPAPSSNPTDYQNDPNAAGVLAGAAGEANGSKSAINSDPALESLKLAHKDAQAPKPKPGFNLMLVGFLIIVGLASAYGIRSYLGKVIPNSPV
ncbi:MAG: hypothetical protein KF824_03785 [Fimbriimonadaceae bacterium]|nr:MAG: hypothetical protein KF824_03785 [Fimbriimonadaceae bacterium]